jgi:hypothetical protein
VVELEEVDAMVATRLVDDRNEDPNQSKYEGVDSGGQPQKQQMQPLRLLPPQPLL